MKTSELRKKIIINFSTSIGLMLVFSAIFSYNSNQEDKFTATINKLKSETSTIQSQAAELRSKTSDIRKYKTILEKMSENKKSTAGIKMDDFNSKLNYFATTYRIFSPAVKVALPENLKDGLFQRTTIDVFFTTVNLSFDALDDVAAISFVSNLTSSLPGTIVVSNFEMKKSKDYSEQDFVAITSGTAKGNISGKLDFYWYAYKDKEANESNKEDKSSKENKTNNTNP